LGFGLQTMRERADAIGGTLAVRPREGSGTVVEVRVPEHAGA
jgi:signal transduction histidine kinase